MSRGLGDVYKRQLLEMRADFSIYVHMDRGEIIIYQTADGETRLDVRMENDSVWLTQAQIAQLFGTEIPAISKHIRNIFQSGELEREATVSKMEIVQMEGNRKVKREPEFYNLDAIIAVGYRVNSKKATRFRQWATKTLKEYITKGFVLNDDMLKNGKLFGKDYFAVTGKTAAELVYERVNAEKPAMGLTTWKDAPDGKILKRDISVAKNYLNEKELSRLNRLVTMFIDYAELMAEDEVLMSMQDWVEQTNQFLRNNRREVLEGKGKVSHDMVQKRQF